jgi:hypothetical protein
MAEAAAQVAINSKDVIIIQDILLLIREKITLIKKNMNISKKPPPIINALLMGSSDAIMPPTTMPAKEYSHIVNVSFSILTLVIADNEFCVDIK